MSATSSFTEIPGADVKPVTEKLLKRSVHYDTHTSPADKIHSVR